MYAAGLDNVMRSAITEKESAVYQSMLVVSLLCDNMTMPYESFEF